MPNYCFEQQTVAAAPCYTRSHSHSGSSSSLCSTLHDGEDRTSNPHDVNVNVKTGTATGQKKKAALRSSGGVDVNSSTSTFARSRILPFRPSQSRRQQSPNNKPQRRSKRRKGGMTVDEAEAVEFQLLQGLEHLQLSVKHRRDTIIMSNQSQRAVYTGTDDGEVVNVDNNNDNDSDFRQFPSVRGCNAAIAAFGDADDFLRGLRLFVKMRKAASLQKCLHLNHEEGEGEKRSILLVPNIGLGDMMSVPVPAPTLVTYSTLMSRAVQSGKMQVALRLWRLMKLQSEFFTHFSVEEVEQAFQMAVQNVTTTVSASSAGSNNINMNIMIVPDTRSANILMNAYAKMGDVEAAQNLLSQMLATQWTAGSDVPPLTPNSVTYNTLIDACRRAGDLTKGLQTLQDMRSSGSQPDARTYTSLISTVARQRSSSSTSTSRSSSSSSRPLFGSNDPDMAFTLLSEMVNEQHLRPNGITYCALIDVCGRCGRPDLALKGLRMMLHQKKQEEEGSMTEYMTPGGRRRKFSWSRLSAEHRESELNTQVGAWTAAINACGRGGRVSTAIRLFGTMQNSIFNTMPNTVTCGCLADCLLRAEDHPNHIAEILDVLRYMKTRNMEPTEFMYTSLIAAAGRLVEMEKSQSYSSKSSSSFVSSSSLQEDNGNTQETKLQSSEDSPQGDARAIDVYTELMRTLIRSPPLSSSSESSSAAVDVNKSDNTMNMNDSAHAHLEKVFLVFEEIKSAGAQPDIASYNALLRACAQAGDLDRTKEVIQWMEQQGGVDPNRYSWVQALHAASQVTVPCNIEDDTSASLPMGEGEISSDIIGPVLATESIWKQALSYHLQNPNKQGAMGVKQWKPNMDAYEALLQGYWNEAISPSAPKQKTTSILNKIVQSYLIVRSSRIIPAASSDDPTSTTILDGLEFVRLSEVHDNQQIMFLLLRAAVSLHLMGEITTDLAIRLAEVPRLQNFYPSNKRGDHLRKSHTTDQEPSTQSLKALTLVRQWSSDIAAAKRQQNGSLERNQNNCVAQ
jgi:pentatricopeptide repeat protein